MAPSQAPANVGPIGVSNISFSGDSSSGKPVASLTVSFPDQNAVDVSLSCGEKTWLHLPDDLALLLRAPKNLTGQSCDLLFAVMRRIPMKERSYVFLKLPLNAWVPVDNFVFLASPDKSGSFTLEISHVPTGYGKVLHGVPPSIPVRRIQSVSFGATTLFFRTTAFSENTLHLLAAKTVIYSD